ncbi:hypothetical protein CRE_22935 [Caenorhabditis remanei]|uniref:DUF38 domain-containing protein n=1 Tax=Caenorhabditis remanei TaxID=31234 RepID=E3MW66_CAERE|nr:hypothetical protein CRE_22935 [Caenorhabditis remanei]
MSIVFNNDEVEVKPEATLAQIFNVPDFVGKYLDIDTRFCLRATCTTIREIINEKPLHIDHLNYNSNGNAILISTNGTLKVSYQIIEEGLRVRYWDRMRLINAISKEEKVEIIQRDLKSILGSEKLRIGTFEIENNHISGVYDEKPPIGLRALRNTMSQVPNKLKIINLEYWAVELDEVFIVALKRIDLENFKCLKLTVAPFFNNCTPIWKDLYDLEEWKRLKSLKVYNWQLDVLDILRFFTHVENAHFEINSFYNTSDFTSFVMELKDKLLQSPNLKQFKIHANKKMLDSDFEEINASLQQYNTNNAPYSCWISFPYPDSDKKLELLVEKKMLWFKGPCNVEGEGGEECEDVEEEKEEAAEEGEDEDEEVPWI